jgi:hypothetical protein
MNEIVSQRISLDGVEIRQDAEGRFCLNDLHKAAGGERRHSPHNWTSRKETEVISSEVQKNYQEFLLCKSKQGDGTFVVKELAYLYASWVGGWRLSLKMLESVGELDRILAALREFEVPSDIPDMFVYAIREHDTGNIKLGISRNPLQRLKTLQVGNSSKLSLVAYRRALNRFADEREAHSNAGGYSLHGEWFTAEAARVLQ